MVIKAHIKPDLILTLTEITLNLERKYSVCFNIQTLWALGHFITGQASKSTRAIFSMITALSARLHDMYLSWVLYAVTRALITVDFAHSLHVGKTA